MKPVTKQQTILSMQWLKSPLTVLVSMVLGISAGLYFPDFSKNWAMVGEIYLKLLQMTIIPVLMSAVISSVGKLFAAESARASILKIITTSLIFLFVVGALSIVISLFAGPGRYLSEEAKILLGKTLNVADQSGGSDAVTSRGAAEFLHAMIPSNIFYDLGRGSNLSILFFSLILGVAIGTMGGKKANSILEVAEGLFEAFSKIVDWSMYLLPVGLFSLLANQLASTGTDILAAMLRFVLIVWGTVLLVIVVNTAIMCLTLRRSPLVILSALKQSMLIAFGTSNSIAAMPSTIEALTSEKIKLPSNIINLVVPIGVVLNSFSMIIMYIAASVFAAELYGVPLHAPQIVLVILLSVLAAIAGAGAPSIVCISMISIVLLPLGLPAQAIIVLLIAVDPLIDPIGTVANIHTNATISVLVARGDKNEDKGSPT